MDTLVLHIDIVPPKPWSEIAILQLSEAGCNAFEETKTGLIAYASLDEVNKAELITSFQNWAKQNDIEFSLKSEIVKHQNWNAIWEADFQPVEVDEHLTILAPFHDKANRRGMIIEIQPQMSFGTGHHQTTWMMSKAIFEFGRLPNSILDMGTGTGILAIVAEKLGAQDILAIDIEEWSAQNTRENAIRNECKNIKTLHGDIDLIQGKSFGLILANINKNVLKAQFDKYAEALETNGRIIISGFFETDVEDMSSFTQNLNFEVEKKWSKESWAALQLKRK
jgi:ribosomal protein L11 methyltransferase